MVIFFSISPVVKEKIIGKTPTIKHLSQNTLIWPKIYVIKYKTWNGAIVLLNLLNLLNAPFRPRPGVVKLRKRCDLLSAEAYAPTIRLAGFAKAHRRARNPMR